MADERNDKIELYISKNKRNILNNVKLKYLLSI